MGLASRGHEVTAVARSSGGDMSPAEIKQMDEAGIQQVHVGLPASRRVILPEYCRQIWRQGGWVIPFSRGTRWTLQRNTESLRYLKEIQRLSPHVVHVHFGDLGARMARLGRFSGFPIPNVVTWHGYEATALASQLGPETFLELFQSDCLHTVGSVFMQQRLIALGARPESINVIPMGIDLERFGWSQEPKSRHGTLRVLSVGRLVEVKGHSYLLEAIGKLAQAGRRVELRLVGDGPLREALEAQAKDLAIESRVSFAGGLEQDEVVSEMRKADLFALTGVIEATGRAEGQGLVYAEAQAMGLPVIASDVGGVRDSIVDEETGFLCHQRDVEMIAQKIAYFDEYRGEIFRFGARGRAFVECGFSKERMLDAFETLYGQITLEQGLQKSR
ncbi:glycosyltransferase [Ectothiorhodospira sp. 9100]|nr:glycosyltransferase [Ectothiorhodospira sp. 9100]MCG5519765.1 glycosyltransferase [Ectothiorhodospira sp. 9905]